jgi:RND family efflux transporter MFP subunit
MYMGLRSTGPMAVGADRPAAGAAADPSAAGPEPTSELAIGATLPDVVVTLGQEAVARAGITVEPVTAGTVPAGLRSPGVVEANAYKQVVVTPLVGGRITGVSAELGQRVDRGQILAEIFSPELAEAQTRYVSVRADLEAHERELARTETLVKIGAASGQELERIHAGHTARRADVQSAAARLQLLGLPVETIEGLGPGQTLDATISVPAPISGAITERMANVGLNVDPSVRLFTVLDLSTVWVVANVHERDVSQVRIGSPATVTTTAFPNLVLHGQVSYIDPQLNVETRTAKVRIEVSNPRQELRLGMYAEALFSGADDGAPTPTLPRSAVQNVSDRTVVYVVNPEEAGRFIEREVRLGRTVGDRVAVLSGVQPGDGIVTRGSFAVRAERERLGLRTAAGQAATGNTVPASVHAGMQASATVQEVRIAVTETSFEPPKVTLSAGVPARLVFTRATDKTCATSVVFASLKIKKELPLNEPVTIEFTPSRAGEIAFACGMNMLRGTLVVH